MTRGTLLSGLLLIGLILTWAYMDQIMPPETVHAAVIRVSDGDTFELGNPNTGQRTGQRTGQGTGQRIRLAGIDAPEYHQMCMTAANQLWPCGAQSRTHLEALIHANAVRCAIEARDVYHRAVSTCATNTVPDIGAAMVWAGLAISPDERGAARYAQQQAAARIAHRGLWQGVFQAPAEWRAAHPRS